MIIAYLGILFILLVLLVFVAYKFLAKKPKEPLKVGDYVMFKRKYKNLFPLVPTSHALVIEKIIDNEATVVFMTMEAISKATLPLHVLSRAV